MNQVHLSGRFGSDIEEKEIDGKKLYQFSFATEEVWGKGKNQRRTDWHQIKVWGKTGEIIHRNFKKGDFTILHGKIRTDSWEKDGQKRYSTYILVDRIDFVPGGNKTSGQSSTNTSKVSSVDNESRKEKIASKYDQEIEEEPPV